VRRRGVIDPEPEDEPPEPQRAGRDERPPPAEREGEWRHHEWSDDRADVGARVEEPGRERPVAFGEPLGDGLDRDRKVARLAEPQREPRHPEAEGTARE